MGAVASPLDLTGCVGWFDASTLTGADASTIALWSDRSGQACHLNQVFTGNPTLKLGIRNGRNVVRFVAASTQSIVTATAPLGTLLNGADLPFCLIASFSQANTTGRQDVAAWTNGTINTTFVECQINSTVGPELLKGDNVPATSNAQLTNAPDTSWHVCSWNCTGTAADIVLDTTISTLGVTCDVGTQSINRFGVGGLVRSTPTDYFNGDIGEIIVYNRYLSSAERIAIEQYLFARWIFPPVSFTFEKRIEVGDGMSMGGI